MKDLEEDAISLNSIDITDEGQIGVAISCDGSQGSHAQNEQTGSASIRVKHPKPLHQTTITVDELPEMRTRGISGLPLGRKMSKALHKASARVVNITNVENVLDSNNTSQMATPFEQYSIDKDYFTHSRHLVTPILGTKLSGYTLRLFGPSNRLRRVGCSLLLSPWTEPCLLLLIFCQTIILTIDSSYTMTHDNGELYWGGWTDWALLGVFICYTIEICLRIIVSGLVVNPAESTIYRKDTVVSNATGEDVPRSSWLPQSLSVHTPHVFRRLTSSGSEDAQTARRAVLLNRAYLRRSFNRIDCTAVFAYWLYVGLAISGLEFRYHLFVFKAVSCLRILRLLNLTKGTTTILKSLKKSAPLLVNVALFVGFFWLFMAVIGVQSFKGSFRRQCVWTDSRGLQQNQTQELQFCGGHLQEGVAQPFLLSDWQSSHIPPKGYLCPEQSLCVSGPNPYNGTVHFDNIFNAMELVFVIMSSNTFSDLMYYTMDSDYFAAAFFFIVGILVLTFWLMSLVIAVVTTSFQVIREEQQSSAFAAKPAESEQPSRRVHVSSIASKAWQRTTPFWVLLVIAALGTQAAKTSSMPSWRWNQFETAEAVFTALFALEIVCRALCCAPNWKNFNTKSNWFDCFLAVITCVIQIPHIRHAGSIYRWLTVFQIMRAYRVIQYIPFTRDLLLRILGNASGLLNLMFFLICVVYIAALVACQLVRGDAPQEVYGEAQEMTFKNIYNSFLAMYQILSSENWTTILYGVQSSQTANYQAWVGAIFFIVWFVFGQNILMSMFIAVLQENFEVSESDKRREQVRAFVEEAVPKSAIHEHTNLTLLSLLKRRTQQPQKHHVSNFGVLYEDNVNDFLDSTTDTAAPARAKTMKEQLHGPLMKHFSSIWNWLRFGASKPRISNPFTSQKAVPELPEHNLDPSTLASDLAQAHGYHRLEQFAYLRMYPEYDKVLWMFGPQSRFRRFCQRIVASSHGERLSATTQPSPIAWYMFSALMYLCTVAIVVLACYVTPIYQKAYTLAHHESRFAWFSWCDLGFTLIFTIEFVIKVGADGFWLTPNAYFHNAWNRIDAFVLLTLWVNVIADFLDRGSLSRAFRAFKALRALRLVNISDATKATFYDVLIAGFWNIAGAAIVSIALLIPTAIWGLNMFAGLLYSCNDGDVTGLSQCINEYSASPSSWNFWAPRAWENPSVWSFDSFGSSLLILFEIVSQEGWIDVMTSTMSITGRGQQPSQDASSTNAMFFIIFNLLGAVFVLTLFIAVIIQNYSERSGIAYLTAEQRAWQEMRLILKQVRPSRRPVDAPPSSIRRKCYFAVRKRSTWNRILLAAYCLHVLLLMTEHFPDNPVYTSTRTLNVLYCVNIAVRILGLGWPLFIRSRWNIFNLIVIPVSLALNVIVFRVQDQVLTGILTAEKIFLVLVAMNLIPAIDPLDQLFKTTVGALPDLASLMATWLVLFVTFAVAFNQIFGLTKINNNGSDNINFRTVPKALIVLFRMSCGEGWNSIMHDFTISEPYCTSSTNFYDSDCGSTSWAYFLFITWNILSMYIFVNIVISLVYNNFSYVYQRSGKMSSISRDEIRRFKATWASFDDGTGHISKADVGKFLYKLGGAFEVRIYPKQYSVHNLLENCSDSISYRGSSSSATFNIQTLRRATNAMNVAEINKRRQAFNRLYVELMNRRNPKGISFTAMLLIVSHNKFVDENKSLNLSEFLHRRSIRMDVDRVINFQRIYGVFKAFQARSRLLQHLGRASADLRRTSTTRRPSTLSPDDNQSITARAGSPNARRPSATSSVAQKPGYGDLLADSAWSSALGGTALQRSVSRISSRFANVSDADDDDAQ